MSLLKRITTMLALLMPALAFSREILQGCTSLTEAAAENGLDRLIEAMDMVRDVSSAQNFLEQAGSQTLNDEEFTIFTPDNDAWAELNADIDALEEDTVFNIIGGHIIPGKITKAELMADIEQAGGLLEVETRVEGSFLEFASANGDIYITPKGVPSGQQPAVLVMSDIDTCAGLVHTVSQVLVPEGEEVERIGELDAKDEGTGKPCASAQEVVDEKGLTVLQDALAVIDRFPSSQDIVPALKATTVYNEQWTFFAPTDEAFLKAAGDVRSLSRLKMDILLANHVLVDQRDAAEIRNVAEDFAQGDSETNTVEALFGDLLRVGTNDNKLTLQAVGSDRPPATVIEGNIKTCGGIIHIIDDVLVPEGFEEMEFEDEDGASNFMSETPATPSEIVKSAGDMPSITSSGGEYGYGDNQEAGYGYGDMAAAGYGYGA